MRKFTTAITVLLFSLCTLSVQAEDLKTEFTSFSIVGQVTSTIDAEASTVSVTMPSATDLTALIPTFTLSEGAVLYLGTDQVTSTVTAIDFSSAVTFTIKNGESKASQDWVVTVENEAAATVSMTFNVDMTVANLQAGDVVYVTGTFADMDSPTGWNQPGTGKSLLLEDADGDMIYTGTADVPANDSVAYKYFIGADWSTGDPAGDRYVLTTDADVVIDPADKWNNGVGVRNDVLGAVSMYPNPVSSMLTIANLDNAKEVVVTNVLGQAIFAKAVDGAKMTISTSEFKTGIYVVTVISENGLSRSERIVKQ